MSHLNLLLKLDLTSSLICQVCSKKSPESVGNFCVNQEKCHPEKRDKCHGDCQKELDQEMLLYFTWVYFSVLSLLLFLLFPLISLVSLINSIVMQVVLLFHIKPHKMSGDGSKKIYEKKGKTFFFILLRRRKISKATATT